jgi:hypothetical protein
MTGDSPTRPSNRLPILAAEIREAHGAARAAAQTVVDRARDAGTKLIEAKGLLGHGEWSKPAPVLPSVASRDAGRVSCIADPYRKPMTQGSQPTKAPIVAGVVQ